jgi:hypothetical protein
LSEALGIRSTLAKRQHADPNADFTELTRAQHPPRPWTVPDLRNSPHPHPNSTCLFDEELNASAQTNPLQDNQAEADQPGTQAPEVATEDALQTNFSRFWV